MPDQSRSRPRAGAVAGGPPLAGCPSPCDPDCEADCHEGHVPPRMRSHEPGWSCGETQLAVAEAVSAERERAATAEARVAELENAVTWGTSCTSCARVLDSAYEQTCRAERAEGKLAAIERQCGKAAGVLRRGAGVPFNLEDVMVDARYILQIIGSEEENHG